MLVLLLLIIYGFQQIYWGAAHPPGRCSVWFGGGDLSSSSYVEASVSEPHVSEMATQDLHMHSVGHCCALFRHIQCIMCMYLILSGPLMRVSYLMTIRYILKWEMLRQRVFLSFLHVFCNFMKITTKSPRKVQKWSQKSPDLVPKA